VSDGTDKRRLQKKAEKAEKKGKMSAAEATPAEGAPAEAPVAEPDPAPESP